MSSPPNHALVPLNETGLKMIETLFNVKFKISNKTLYKLHLLLRHSNEIENCNSGGFFKVSYVIKYMNTNLQMLVNTVYNNNKNRYQFSIFKNELYIRANQGHSGNILNNIIPEHIYTLYISNNNVFHRTAKDISNIIFSEDESVNGLRPIGRLVHMATSEELSRKANKFPIKIIIDVVKAKENGIIFWKAANDVILSYNSIPKSCLFIAT